MTKVFNHITEDEKTKLARITQDCLDTHVFNPPKGRLILSVSNSDGKEIEIHEMLSKSWTRNFYNILLSDLFQINASVFGSTAFGDGSLKVKKDTGTEYSMDAANHSSNNVTGMIAGAGITDRGILAGLSDSTESFDSYDMASLIANGTSTNQMSYSAQESTAAVWDSETRKMTVTLTRYLNNNSSASIDVKEVGYKKSHFINNSNAYFFLMNRDVLPSTVTVPSGGQLKIDYVIECVLPS